MRMREVIVNNTIVFMLVLFMCFSVIAMESSMSIKTTEIIDNEITESKLQSSLGVNFGTSNNVGRLSTQIAGTYSKINPSITYERSFGDTTLINSELSMDFKRYLEKNSAELGDEQSFELTTTALSFLTENLELGGDLVLRQIKNSIPMQMNDADTNAIFQEYIEPDLRVNLMWSLQENIAIEQGLSVVSRKNSEILLDRGNSFYNDFVATGGDLKLTFELSPYLKVSVKGILEDKRYSEKPADYTDGAASGPVAANPTLYEISNEYLVFLETEVGKVKLVTIPAYRINKDKIYGARDSNTFRIQQKIIMAISRKLSWSATIAMSEEKFTQFRSAPESNPFGGDFRTDTEIKISSPIKYSINEQFQIMAEYVSIRKDSNYANSSYSEQVLSAGINLLL